MGSSATQSSSTTPSSEKRRRANPVNVPRGTLTPHQRLLRETVTPEICDSTPVAILGPVPSIREQAQALMQDPNWVLAALRREQAEEKMIDPGLEEMDWEDDDPEITTGYEVTQMAEIFPPEDITPDPIPPESEGTPPTPNPEATTEVLPDQPDPG